MKSLTLSILIAAVALLSSIRTVAQSPTPFTATFSFPNSYNISLPQVSPCCLWDWAITPLQVSSSISGGIVVVKNISVSGNVTIQGQPIGGFDWDVFIGPSSFGLPTAGRINVNSPFYGGNLGFSAPVVLRFAEGGFPSSASTAINGSWDFSSGMGSTPCCANNFFKQAVSSPFNISRSSLNLQIAIFTGDPRTNLIVSGITATISGVVLPPSFSVSQAANFPDQPVNTTTTMAEGFTNVSSSPITLGTLAITGPDAPSFTGTVVDCFERTLAPNDTCTIQLNFSPVRTGTHQASLLMNDLTGLQLQVITLSGNATGTQPTYVAPTYNVSIVGEPWPPGAQRVDFTSLNNHGDMAGWTSLVENACVDSYGNPASYSHAFLYTSGVFTDIGALPNAVVSGQPSCYPPSSGPRQYGSEQYGIGALNDSGVLVGTADGANGQRRTFEYTGGVIHDLQDLVTDGTLLPADNVAGAINRSGQVFFNNGSICASWIFDSGKVYPLQKPTNLPACDNSDIVGPWASHSLKTHLPYPNRVPVPNDDGRAPSGVTLPPARNSTAAVFQNGLFTDLGIPGEAISMNSAGQAVGFSNSGPFFWDRNAGYRSLTSLVPGGWNITGGGYRLLAINDAAQILTAGQGPEGNFHYVLLSPIVSTPTGSNVAIQSGGTTLTFSNITSSGATSVTPIDPTTVGQVPGGFSLGPIAYQISTTATFSGPVTIAFQVPGPISQTDFNNLSILHNDPQVGLVDVTASSPPRDYSSLTIYASTTSLSPFYLIRRGYHIMPLFNQQGVAKAGRTIPVKLQVLDQNNQNISASTLTVKARTLQLLSSSVSGLLIASGNANPDNNFRYDSTIGTTGGYIYNLSTKGLVQGVYSLSFYVGADRTFFYTVAFEIR